MQQKILSQVCEFMKNPAELVKIVLTEYRGKRYADVRVYYDSSDSAVPDWKPTKKGVCLSVELLDDLHEGIEKAIASLDGDRKIN